MATHSSILAWRVPMDRGAWWAIVHRVAQSWTWLKWLSLHVPCNSGQSLADPMLGSCGWRNEEQPHFQQRHFEREVCWLLVTKVGTQNWCAFTCVISLFSLWSEREKQILTHNSGVWQNCYRQSSLHSKSRDTDIENKCKDAEVERGRMGWTGRLGLMHIHYWYCV